MTRVQLFTFNLANLRGYEKMLASNMTRRAFRRDSAYHLHANTQDDDPAARLEWSADCPALAPGSQLLGEAS